MMRSKLAILASFLVVAAASCGGLALGQTGGQSDQGRTPGGTIASADVAIATVVAIDQQTRKVTLRGEGGKEWTFTAGPEVRNLAQVQRGDRVLVQYFQGLALGL